MTFGKSHNGLAIGKGSYAKTSRQAPAIFLSLRAAINAGSFTNEPLAILIKDAPAQGASAQAAVSV